MKTILRFCTSLFAVAVTGTAFAADLPIRTKAVAPPAPALTWTGFYIGGNVGYSWGRVNNDVTATGLPSVLFGIPTASLAAGDRDRQDVDGVIGGFQSGYNWQIGMWVFGIETDLQASDQKGDRRYCNLGGTTCAVASLDASHQLSWFGTARSRIGYLVTPTTLIYATGGAAYGEFKSNYTFNLGGVPFATFNFKDLKAGWTAGAGVEFAFFHNWSAKIEYLYLDFGSSETSVAAVGASAAVSREFTDHIARVGINYRFGSGGVLF